MLPRKVTLRRPPKLANPFAPILLQTLRPSEKRQAPSNQHFPDSFVKTPGVGGTRHSPLGIELSAPPAAPGLCFHIVTNPFSHNSFAFTSIQIPGGCTPRQPPVGAILKMQRSDDRAFRPILMRRHHAHKSSWHESSLGNESRKKLCGAMRLGRTCSTKSKIPMVANFASERTNQQERRNDPFHHAPSPRPAHSIAAADWTVFIVSKLYKAHRTAFIRAGPAM
jgi:hypothetical protein